MKILSVIVLILICVLSLACFVLCAADKYFAKKQMRRIPEKVFFFLALSGGGAGLWLGMTAFRHKTKHWYFWLWAVLFTVLWFMLLIFLTFKVSSIF